MKKYGILLAVILLLAGCQKKSVNTAADIPDYTMVPATAPTAAPTAEEPEETSEPVEEVEEEKKPSGIITKTVKKYEQEEIDMSELEGVDNFSLTKDNSIQCHDSNESGSNTFSIYEKKGTAKWKKSENKVIAAFVQKYHVQVTKMKNYLVTDFDETILMGDDYIIYKLDEDGNEIASAKMTKMFGKGSFEIHDWYWYKGNKVIANLSKFDSTGMLEKKLCCLIDIDRQKVEREYSADWEMRLFSDGKIYGDQTDHNMLLTIVVVNPENGQTEEKISASEVRKTALDRTDWDKENNDYYRNAEFSYDVYNGEIYIKYLTGVYRYDTESSKWQQLLKESKNYKMGKCSPVVFKVADENHFYMMGKKGFYLYSAKEKK